MLERRNIYDDEAWNKFENVYRNYKIELNAEIMR